MDIRLNMKKAHHYRIPTDCHTRIAMAGLTLLLPSIHDALANSPACASATAAWQDNAGNWGLSQDSKGFITGQFTVLSAQQCPINETYKLSGAYQGNGKFTVNGTYNGSNPGCAASFSYSGTISGPGCAAAGMSWSNSAGLSGTSNWTSKCQIPTGESAISFTGWSTSQNQATEAIFHQYLAQFVNGYMDWGGRTIAETFPQNGTDTCYFALSAVPPLNGIPGTPFTLASGAGYNDIVGVNDSVVKYYRNTGRTPCGVTNHQVMVIDCPTGNQTYATNTLITTLGDLTVTDSRAGVQSPSLKWGPPPPKNMISTWINIILQKTN